MGVSRGWYTCTHLSSEPRNRASQAGSRVRISNLGGPPALAPVVLFGPFIAIYSVQRRCPDDRQFASPER